MNEKVIIHKRQEDKPWDLSLTKLLAASAFYHLSRHDSMGNCIVPDVVSIQCAFLHQWFPLSCDHCLPGEGDRVIEVEILFKIGVNIF